MNTYMSNNGGVTWIEIAKGFHTYEIGDQGGFLILVKHNSLTNEYKFTYNSGKTWEIGTFDTKKAYINNIIVELSNNHHHFLGLGYQMNDTKDGTNGVVYNIDFSNYHMRQCIGHDRPDTKNSDYIKFIPHSFKNQQCLMGRTISYVVKKPEVRCINPDHYQSYVVEKNCECTYEDYDCDIGFVRSKDGKCTNKSGLSIDFSPPKDCKGTYLVKMGYRKNTDNSCQGGIIIKDKEFNCKVSNYFHNSTTRIKFDNIFYNILWYGSIFGILSLCIYFMFTLNNNKLFKLKNHINICGSNYNTRGIYGSNCSSLQQRWNILIKLKT